jgi:signal transduction histidine kinase
MSPSLSSLSRGEGPTKGSPASRSPDQETVDILLVDDHPAKLLSYEVILSPLRENLIKAGSASEALEQLLKRDVAIILIDVCMPDLDGFQLATMIREHPRFQKTAIIFISAIQVTELDLLRGYQLGAVDYVPVPVIPELLRAKVKVFAELYRKTRQLEKLNAELELRVAERTAELARANAELEQRVEERTREREEALAQVHEMQKLESLGQVTGGVAHDFNNVLMAVLGNLELVKKYLTDNSRAQRLIDAAIQGAERGAALTKRMLAFARRQELRPERVDIGDLIDGMIEMLRRSLGPTIQIATDFEPGLAPVRVDPNQLELALLNLAVNARDAMPSGGQLIIESRSEGLQTGAAKGPGPGDYVCIRVKDTGSGMDEETRRRATEPFFTTKRQDHGTGLGLSMVDGLVAQSGGAMRISSRPGYGTMVELWLPVSEAAEPDRPKLAAAPFLAGDGRAFRVLLVDDDAMVSAGTAAMLEDLGHSVIGAESARQALDLLSAQPDIDIVITDYAMPGMTGRELAVEIDRIRPGLPVVIATGYVDGPYETPGLPRLNKPYRQQDLAAVIASLLEAAPSEPARTIADIGAAFSARQ